MLLKVFGGKVKKYSFVKFQYGGIVVEAAYVMPIVIIAIFILVYMALIQIQQGVMYVHAQSMARKICNISTFPGYEKFFEDAYNTDCSATTLPNVYQPSISVLDLIYKKHDPYRYLGGVYLNEYNNYEEELKLIVEKSMYFNNGISTVEIDTSFSNLSTAVTVIVNYNVNLPKFVRILGLDSSVLITTKAVSYANDTVEFIRNTDLAFDLFDYFLKKYHLEDKINTFYKKIKEISEKLF